jgi:hypothetical protein
MPSLSNFISATGLPTAFTTLNAGENVSLGDIIVQGADGNGYYAVDPSLPNANLRPISQATSEYGVTVVPATTASSTASTNSVSFVLSNGNIGIVYAQGANLYFSAIGPSGTVAVAPVLLSSTYSAAYGVVNAIPLSVGGFAVAFVSYPSTNNYYPMLGIFSNSGAAVGAPITLYAGTLGGGTGFTFQMPLCQISNGDIVVLYRTALSGSDFTSYFSIYSSTGSTVVASTLLNAIAETTAVLSVTALGTGFVVGSNSNGEFACALVYSSTGQFTTSLTSTVGIGGNEPNAYAVALPNGNVLIYCTNWNSTDYLVTFLIVSPTGTLVSGGESITFGTSGNAVATAVPLSGSGFALFVAYNTTGVIGYIFNSSGVMTVGPVTVAAGTGFTAASLVDASLMSNGNIAVTYAVAATDEATLIALNPTTLAPVGSPLTIGIVSDNPIVHSYAISFAMQPNAFTFLIAGASASGLQFIAYCSEVQACTPVGVATTAAVEGTAIPIQALGAVTTRLTFAKPYSINAQANTPPGQEMSVVGNLAILKGIQ